MMLLGINEQRNIAMAGGYVGESRARMEPDHEPYHLCSAGHYFLFYVKNILAKSYGLSGRDMAPRLRALLLLLQLPVPASNSSQLLVTPALQHQAPSSCACTHLCTYMHTNIHMHVCINDKRFKQIFILII